ncbi:AGE family epimerase/isomerase [Nocardioides sp. GXQ0305]|uniref:AGE family epimerase/isomerase n=1 Tax=Nocardioides sp. GXQ0305 TaxID=3423912 RepID=UPI003D7C4D51
MTVRTFLAAAATMAAVAAGSGTTGGGPAAASVPSAADRPVPEVLAGDTWLRHLREDLLPYWEMPVALGDPLGNFPTWRDPQGELDPERGTWRGVSTLARGVYGYSVAFHLTGEEKYLEYARAGLQWIEENAYDETYEGWYRDLTDTGAPRAPRADKPIFDLASLGLAYGMYFNVTRDPWAERGLLGVRDLIFDTYAAPDSDALVDAMSFDMSTQMIGNNGFDITNLLVPATALLLPNADLLTDQARRVQFRDDLRTVTDVLLDLHRNTATPETWWFWGRSAPDRQVHEANQTDFGITIKTHEMIHNANQVFPDRPWSDLAADRDAMLERAWDAPAARWHADLNSFTPGDNELDSPWWMHNEADQTLAALDLREDFARSDWLETSAQGWFDAFVDPAYPYEVWQRPTRDPALANLEKSGRGKNMYHAFEHTLVMYLHGRAMEGRPAELHYALPGATALTAEAEPYWFDATTEHRVVGAPVDLLPGHRHVTVELSGLDEVPDPLYPPPDDVLAPVTQATVEPAANDAGWHRAPVSLDLTATDAGVGVRELRVQVRDLTGAAAPEASITPGDTLSLPFSAQGDYEVTYAAVDRLGNTEEARTIGVRLDRTAPTVDGMPNQPCRLGPPRELVTVADLRSSSDDLSGVADVDVVVTADEATRPWDIVVDDGLVKLRAVRDRAGDGRVYTITATVTDAAGNATTETATCTVPRDPKP